ncbi:MAG TPA: glycosyltransferase [Candidatus Limnocylindria bacterium]|nr:glycosyltransferase [Candidatus Limnocylindria bacterium]
MTATTPRGSASTRRDPLAAGAPSVSEISVVICAYTLDRWDEIRRAVASVEAQTAPVREIILVADHNEALLARAEAAFPAVRVVANAQAQGLSGARNTGVAHATGEIVAFLDDDAAADPDWATWLAAGYADGTVLGVGGLSEADWVEARPSWFPPEFDWVVGCSYLGLPTGLATVRNMIGSNMSLRRAIFDTIGGFDARVGRVGSLPVGCEETELCIRAVARWPGSRIVYQPRARVRHRVPAGRGTWRYYRSRCLAEGRSKARVTRLVGATAGLATERSYVRRTLPAGVLRGVRDAMLGRRTAPVARSSAIVAGFALTALGYAHGMLFDRTDAKPDLGATPIPGEVGPG